jgi:hypothetical protein
MDANQSVPGYAVGPAGAEAGGHTDGEALRPDLAAEIRFLENERDEEIRHFEEDAERRISDIRAETARKVAHTNQLHELGVQKWIKGREEHGDSLGNLNLEWEELNELADARNYRLTRKMLEAGL